jgi:hypothetical protein
MYIQQSTLLSAALIFLTAPSTLAATCINKTGVNTLDLGFADLHSQINGICDSFWRGHTSSHVGGEHVACDATSSSGKYKFCTMALTNIAAQCGGVSTGQFDYNYDGSNEKYVCRGFQGNNGGLCTRGKGKPGGNTCLKKRKGEEGEEKRAMEWTA